MDRHISAREIERRIAASGTNAKKVARDAGLGETYVRDILEGRSRSPTAAKLTKVAEALGCKLDDLLNPDAAPSSAGSIVISSSNRANDEGQPPYSEEEFAVIELWRNLDRRQKSHLIAFLEATVNRFAP